MRVVEGRGYEADGTLSFNAFATISFDPGTGDYTLHSYAQGQVGDRIMPGGNPIRFFEMHLKRLPDTDWPAGGAVGPKQGRQRSTSTMYSEYSARP